MKKHVREALARARALGLVCSSAHDGGHYKLRAEKDGVTIVVPVSCSPTDTTACVNMAMQMLRRRFAERGIQI